ncbi:MAG TPA: hypothetical protein PK950_02690 [Candidatus Paceibacterota bacterium]|nr:hypothetical protein [Candidatus Paceibacterota bacterium]
MSSAFAKKLKECNFTFHQAEAIIGNKTMLKEEVDYVVGHFVNLPKDTFDLEKSEIRKFYIEVFGEHFYVGDLIVPQIKGFESLMIIPEIKYLSMERILEAYDKHASGYYIRTASLEHENIAQLITFEQERPAKLYAFLYQWEAGKIGPLHKSVLEAFTKNVSFMTIRERLLTGLFEKWRHSKILDFISHEKSMTVTSSLIKDKNSDEDKALMVYFNDGKIKIDAANISIPNTDHLIREVIVC